MQRYRGLTPYHRNMAKESNPTATKLTESVSEVAGIDFKIGLDTKAKMRLDTRVINEHETAGKTHSKIVPILALLSLTISVAFSLNVQGN